MILHEIWLPTIVPVADELHIRRSYNIRDSVILHFQDPETQSLDGRTPVSLSCHRAGTSFILGSNSFLDHAERMEIPVRLLYFVVDIDWSEDDYPGVSQRLLSLV